MKKWLLGLSCLFLTASACATMSCGYKDYFHLSDSSHPLIYIASGYSDLDLYLEVVGPRSFVIRDNYCRTGYAHITVAYDENHWCVLELQDGPYMNHPKVNASCSGMRYLGTDYDGFGSYSYSIKLD